MKAAIVSNGETRDYGYLKSILESCNLIICADGGANHVVNCGLVPDALIGDLDSVNKGVLENLRDRGTKIIKHPREKDYTDTQLAIDYAIEAGAHEIVLLCSLGDRIDHSLANILLLVKLAMMNVKAYIINEKNTVYITNKEIHLRGKIGDIVSLIPVGGDVRGVFTEGLQYKLSGNTMVLGDPVGISNVFTCEEITIKIESGFLLVIKSKD